jgi:hypothetical protein
MDGQKIESEDKVTQDHSDPANQGCSVFVNQNRILVAL